MISMGSIKPFHNEACFEVAKISVKKLLKFPAKPIQKSQQIQAKSQHFWSHSIS